MQNKYSVKELATILGCSVTAVNKKIKPDTNNPEIKRYRNRYGTVVENNVTYILLDDAALEDEKNRSKGFNSGYINVAKTVENTSETHNTIDITPINQSENTDKIFEFTERYIERFTKLQETYTKEILETSKQVHLLETSEKMKDAHVNEIEALNKQLKAQNNVLKIVLTVVITLFVTFIITFGVFFIAKGHKAETTSFLNHYNIGSNV